MLSLKKLFFLALLAVSASSCDDSFLGAPIVVIPPGPNGNIIFSQADPTDPFALKSFIFVIDSLGNQVGALGPGLITSKPGNTLAGWTVYEDLVTTELRQGPRSGGTSSAVVPKLNDEETIVHGSAAISPDESRIAFATYNVTTGQGVLYYYKPGKEIAPTPTPVSKTFALGTTPAFSPDGNKLAYFTQQFDASGTPISGTEGFAIADISQGNMIDTNDLSPHLQPFNISGLETIDWSADGTQLLFSADRIQFRYKAGPVGGISFSSYHHGTFSPDGKSIAYVGAADNQLYVESSEGLGRTLLTTAQDSIVYFPCWSPDGKKIIYTSLNQFDDETMASLMVIDVQDPSKRSKLVPTGIARGFWMRR